MADDKAERKAARKRKREEERAKRREESKGLNVIWQYIIGIIVVLGGFICGTGIGWSSPVAKLLKENDITDTQFAWIASIFALGAAISQSITGLSIRFIGLKYTMVVLSAVVGASWIPMVFFQRSFVILLISRLVCGLSGGFCVACPTYIGEMAHKFHRGTLGVFFQLFITGGILYTFVWGISADFTLINIACGAWCGAAIVLIVIFVPETPYYHLRRERPEKAAKVMERIRGKNFDSGKELEEMRASLGTKEPMMDGLKQKVNWKAFGVLLALHVLQQLSGINAVLYHAHHIFEATNTGIAEDLSVILIGIVQVLFTIVAAIAVDRCGRIMLFLISLGSMFVTIALVGVYFTVSRVDPEAAESMGLLPTLTLMLYICGFSIGVGPLPWAMLGEYLPDNVKSLMSTVVATVNWLLAFSITWMMPIVMENFHPEYVFYAFAIVCIVGFFFVLLFVVETNQKTLDEIQKDIGEHKIGFPKKSEN